MTDLQSASPHPPAADTPAAPRRLALAVAACTFVLIFIGGTVTSNDAGLAFPDWPTVEGHNMFLYPPSEWVGDKFFEHVHRLAGATVGMLSIALAVWIQWREPRRWVRTLAWIMLGAVIVQGVMGGLRVTERSVFLAIVHGCFAQLFFSSTLCMVAAQSRDWFATAPARQSTSSAMRRFCVLASVSVFGQLILGAIYRHLGQGLIFHILGAVTVTVMISVLLMWVSGDYASQPLMMRSVKLLAVLLVAQLVLGGGAFVSTMTYHADRPARLWEWLVPSLHVSVGALILAVTVTLTACAHRYAGPGSEPKATRVSPGVTAL